MNITSFEEKIKSEAAASRYLLGLCWNNHQRYCPRCKTRKLYRLAQGRRRCARCGYTFHDFSQRFVNVGHLSCKQWLWLIKLFELDASAQIVAQQLGVAYNTAIKAMNSLRRAILSHALDSAHLIEAGLLRADDEDAKSGDIDLGPPVFGIMERAGWVFVDLVPDLNPGSIEFFKNTFFLKTAAYANIVYTDRYRHYDALLYCERAGMDCTKRHKDRGLSIDAKRGFWAFAKERLRRMRGVSQKWFPFHLKELEFRYNYRGQPLFELLAQRLCGFVPQSEQDSL